MAGFEPKKAFFLEKMGNFSQNSIDRTTFSTPFSLVFGNSPNVRHRSHGAIAPGPPTLQYAASDPERLQGGHLRLCAIAL